MTAPVKRGDPRNLAIFTLGINSALRGVDILRLKIEQVQDLKPGNSFDIREKNRQISGRDAEQGEPSGAPGLDSVSGKDWLFPSKKGKGRLLVPTLTAMGDGVSRPYSQRFFPDNFSSHLFLSPSLLDASYRPSKFKLRLWT
jgi:hypothetical protein